MLVCGTGILQRKRCIDWGPLRNRWDPPCLFSELVFYGQCGSSQWMKHNLETQSWLHCVEIGHNTRLQCPTMLISPQQVCSCIFAPCQLCLLGVCMTPTSSWKAFYMVRKRYMHLAWHRCGWEMVRSSWRRVPTSPYRICGMESTLQNGSQSEVIANSLFGQICGHFANWQSRANEENKNMCMGFLQWNCMLQSIANMMFLKTLKTT